MEERPMRDKLIKVVDQLCGFIERATSEQAKEIEIQVLPSVVNSLTNLTAYAVIEKKERGI